MKGETVKAIQIKECGGPEVMAVVELPVPKPKANEALVKIKAAGVNYIDIYVREGAYRPTLPCVMGQEAGGVVTEVGAEVTTLKPGDRVAYRGVQGSYAEYAAVPAASLVRLPDGISEEQGAALMLQGMTAHYLLHSTYPLKRGETALIHAAAGGVGLLMVQIAHQIGARVIATVGSEEKAKLAREAGADDVIIYSQSDFEAETKRLTNNKGVNVVYDSVGKATFDKGLNVLRPRGYMVNFGSASGPPAPLDLGVLTAKGSLFVTRPSLQHYAALREELEERSSALFGMIKAGKLKLRIEHKYPLAQASQAHRDLQGRKTTGKLLLIP
jgi:NADPH2:quinone reductase